MSKTERPGAPPDRIVIAAVARPHGLKGGIRVKVFNPETSVIAKGARLWLGAAGSEPREVTVRSVTPEKDTWILALAEVSSHAEANAVRGAELSVPRNALPDVEPGEVYHFDLVGREVRGTDGTRLGTVLSVQRYPSVDALVVASPEGAGTTEIPLVEGIVVTLEDVDGAIIVNADTLRG